MMDDNPTGIPVQSKGKVEIDEEDADESKNIETELERLNRASEEINTLENELDETRNKYTSTFSDSSTNLTFLAKKIRKSIRNSRKYFELKERSKAAQAEAVKAARQFQTANGVYRAAKETIALAELKLTQEGASAHLSSAWQEMLNHATIKVMEAELEKTRSEEEHHKKASAYAEMEHDIQILERKSKSSIRKARLYFEYKANQEVKLQQLKQNVIDLQTAISDAKLRYADALQTLESISEHIHESRRKQLLLMYPREPGVGAENTSLPCISELSLDDPRGLSSCTSNEDEADWVSDTESNPDVFESDQHIPLKKRIFENLKNTEFQSNASESKLNASSQSQLQSKMCEYHDQKTSS